MSKIKWEDMVFSNRNQSYGAYQLRRAYGSRVGAAFLLSMGFMSVILAYPMLKPSHEGDVAKDLKDKKVTTLSQPPPPPDFVPPKPPVAPPPVKEMKFVPPKVTDKETDDVPPTNEQLKENLTTTEAGVGDSVVVAVEPPVELPPAPDDSQKIWLTVEQQPEFPGGLQEMMKFLGKNTKYPASARRMGTQGTVFVAFVVDSDGTIDDVQVIKGIQTDCDNEALRVIGKMPQWKPGKQNGKSVKVRFVLPFKFSMPE